MGREKMQDILERNAIFSLDCRYSFKPKQPCVMPDQPVRQEEKRQKAQIRKKYKEIYQGVNFGA